MEWKPNLEIVTEERHRFFLYYTYIAGWVISDDPNTKVGATLVRKTGTVYRMLARGANILPSNFERASGELERAFSERCVTEGANAFAELLSDRAWKNGQMRHAEKVVIEQAKAYGFKVKGSTMYMPWIPCTPCAEEIMQAGIVELIGHKAMIMKTPERWWESTNTALENLKKTGVRCCMYDGSIGNVFSLFNGEIWTP